MTLCHPWAGLTAPTRRWFLVLFGLLMGCTGRVTEAPADLTDPVDQLSYLAFNALRQDSSAQCFVVAIRGSEGAPPEKVTALLVRPGMRIVPLRECNGIFGDGKQHDVWNIAVRLPVLRGPVPRTLAVPYARLCGAQCGTLGTCRFVRRGDRWALEACEVDPHDSEVTRP